MVICDLIGQIRATNRLAANEILGGMLLLECFLPFRHPSRRHWKEAVAMTSLVNHSREVRQHVGKDRREDNFT